MSYMPTSSVRRVADHFEPEAALDPQAQRALRGHLEQIDYAAFAANQEVLARSLGKMDLARFQRLAIAAAQARARWVAAAMAMAEKPEGAKPEEVARLATMRAAYEELTSAYEALRRLVERGYVSYQAAPKA